MLHTIPDALEFIEEEMLGRQSLTEAMRSKNNRLPYLQIRARRVVRNVKSLAAQTIKVCKNYATKTVVTGLIDLTVLLSISFAFPALPLFYILVPLLMLNIVFFGVIYKVQELRKRYPRMIADSSAVMYHATAAIPSPRVTLKATNVNGTISSKTLVRRRSKQNFEKFFPDDSGASSFIVPSSFLPKQQLVWKHSKYQVIINIKIIIVKPKLTLTAPLLSCAQALRMITVGSKN